MNTYKQVTSLTDLIRQFSDEAKCRQFLVQQRWNGCPECPYCKSDKYYVIEGGKRFKCASKTCHKKYSATVGTIFHASNIPLTTWFPAVYLATAHKKGISSCQLAKDLGITQKTAWFVLHRIREALKNNGASLLGNTVELDEVYIGGKVSNMSNKKRKEIHESSSNNDHKVMVVGMLERDGQLRLEVSGKEGEKQNIYDILESHIDKSAFIMTDSDSVFHSLKDFYAGHETVNHSIKEFVRDNVSTNGIEGAFSLFKRSIIGIYHQISPKHLSRYCTESTYRYNTRHLKDGERFELSLEKVNVRLSHKQLIKKTELTAETTIKPSIENIQLEVQGSHKGRKINQIKNGKIIATFISMKEASRVTGTDPSDIRECALGIRNMAKGYQWKFA